MVPCRLKNSRSRRLHPRTDRHGGTRLLRRPVGRRSGHFRKRGLIWFNKDPIGFVYGLNKVLIRFQNGVSRFPYDFNGVLIGFQWGFNKVLMWLNRVSIGF